MSTPTIRSSPGQAPSLDNNRPPISPDTPVTRTMFDGIRPPRDRRGRDSGQRQPGRMPPRHVAAVVAPCVSLALRRLSRPGRAYTRRPAASLTLLATLHSSATKHLAVFLLGHALTALLDYRAHATLLSVGLKRPSRLLGHFGTASWPSCL